MTKVWNILNLFLESLTSRAQASNEEEEGQDASAELPRFPL